MISEVIEHGGKLFIRNGWATDYLRPVRFRTVWPTGLRAADFTHYIGVGCTYTGGGGYRLATGQILMLENGSDTHPDAELSEEQPIPQPPRTAEYRHGRWMR